MTAPGAPRARWRAPGGSGETLVAPPPGAFPALLAENAEIARQWENAGCAFLASPAARQAARERLVEMAFAYSRRYRDDLPPPTPAPPLSAEPLSRGPLPTAPRPPLIVTGHQPRLFHWGVWFKNAVLHALARAGGGVGVNLLIDADDAGSPSLRAPADDWVQPRLATVPFDQPRPQTPIEERFVADPALFASFGKRVAETIRPFVSEPLIEEFWPRVLAAAREGWPIGRCFARARHQWEARWGWNALDLPLSRLCDDEAFGDFAAALLAEAPRWRWAYNTALAEHRAAERIRSRSHPVPALGQAGDAVETPFWLWTADDPRRRGAWLSAAGGELELTDRAGLRAGLPAAARLTGDALRQALARAGAKLRPRALATTLFVRVVLADVFIHGIGGAKYDELTDRIAEKFFGLRPPRHLVATATVRLPLDLPAVTEADTRATRQALRETRFHPEAFLPREPREPATENLLAEKRALLADPPPRGRRRAWRARLTQVNEQLAARLDDRRRELQAREKRQSEEMARWRLLGSREFAFALFPGESLDRWAATVHASA